MMRFFDLMCSVAWMIIALIEGVRIWIPDLLPPLPEIVPLLAYITVAIVFLDRATREG